jgi:hypothetical protein
MEDIRPRYLKKAFLAFILATIIFVSVFLISYIVSYSKSRAIAESQEEIYYNLLNSQLESQLKVSLCDSFNPFEFSENLDSMGSLLGILEERFGKQDERVIKQKKIYSMIELQHALLIKDYNQQCNQNYQIILFFYSNEKEFIDSAEKTGFILSTFKLNNKETMIYSFDYDLNLNIIHLLKEKYQITQPNTIIINENIKITNLQNINELTNATNSQNINITNKINSDQKQDINNNLIINLN